MGLDANEGELQVERLVDTRFEGQSHEISVPVASLDAASLGAIEAEFRERYREAYGVAPEGPIEYAAFRVRLRVPVARPVLQKLPSGASAGAGAGEMAPRPAWFGPEAPVETRVHAREALGAGAELPGPAIIEGSVETVVVPPGYVARVDAVGAVVVRAHTT